jgi:hypothetical protein
MAPSISGTPFTPYKRFCLLVCIAVSTLFGVSSFSLGQVGEHNPGLNVGQGVPRLVKFSGILKDASGQLLNGTVGIDFAIYAEATSGAPLWEEMQNVQFSRGHYAVLLGQSRSTGIPPELFYFGQSHWLGVRILLPGEEEQPRVQLASVPYALKSLDADTLGGIPASAFVQVPFSNNELAKTNSKDFTSAGPLIGGSGTMNYIPIWTDNSGDLGNSVIYQSGTGTSAMLGIGTTTPNATLNISGAGVYTNTTFNFLLGANLGGISIGTSYQNIYGAGQYANYGVVGGVNVPSGATIQQAAGTSGFCRSSADSSGRMMANCAGLFGAGIADQANSAVWGVNPLVMDGPAVNGANLTGAEVDINLLGKPSFVRGINVIGVLGSNGVIPGNSTIGYELVGFNGFQWPIGFQCDRGSLGAGAGCFVAEGLTGTNNTPSTIRAVRCIRPLSMELLPVTFNFSPQWGLPPTYLIIRVG